MWLIESAVRSAIQRAYDLNLKPTSKQLESFEAIHMVSDTADSSRIMTVADGVAHIQITGVLTKSPDFMAMIFGGGNTTYPEIISAIALAEQDENVKDVKYIYDSPGGLVDGLFDTIAAMQESTKPSTAVVHGLAASAAYALAAQQDTIAAKSVASRFGSVGVAVDMFVSDDVVTLTSTNAPRKRPDVTTTEGRAAVVEELDDIHELFVGAIAEGRGKDAETINSEFGQGGTFVASKALKRGMIDTIEQPALKLVTSSTSSSTAQSGVKIQEATQVDIKTLEKDHPETFAAAVEKGVSKERDRVKAHLKLGESCGDMKIAVSAIQDGKGLTAEVQADYLSAGMNSRDINNRQDDSNSANAGDNAPDTSTQTEADEVATHLENIMGISSDDNLGGV